MQGCGKTDYALIKGTGKTTDAIVELPASYVDCFLAKGMNARPLRKVGLCVLAGCLCSTGLELVQLPIQRGSCQLDDVVANTAGAFLGGNMQSVSIEIASGCHCEAKQTG